MIKSELQVCFSVRHLFGSFCPDMCGQQAHNKIYFKHAIAKADMQRTLAAIYGQRSSRHRSISERYISRTRF